jgi:hypothetical protein
VYHRQNPEELLQDGQFLTAAVNTLLATLLGIIKKYKSEQSFTQHLRDKS